MTRKEHELFALLFARVNESIGVLTEILKSRGAVTADDLAAFSHATHYDDAKLLQYANRAREEYVRLAGELGIQADEDLPREPTR